LSECEEKKLAAIYPEMEVLRKLVEQLNRYYATKLFEYPIGRCQHHAEIGPTYKLPDLTVFRSSVDKLIQATKSLWMEPHPMMHPSSSMSFIANRAKVCWPFAERSDES